MKTIIRTTTEPENARRIVKKIFSVFYESSVSLEGYLLLEYSDGDILALNYMSYVLNNTCQVNQVSAKEVHHSLSINTDTGDIFITHNGPRQSFPERLDEVFKIRELKALRENQWKVALHSSRHPGWGVNMWIAGKIISGPLDERSDQKMKFLAPV